jgi:hypothetical protein
MIASPAAHPDDDAIELFASKRIADEMVRERMTLHFENCAACYERLDKALIYCLAMHDLLESDKKS